MIRVPCRWVFLSESLRPGNCPNYQQNKKNHREANRSEDTAHYKCVSRRKTGGIREIATRLMREELKIRRDRVRTKHQNREKERRENYRSESSHNHLTRKSSATAG